MKHRSAIVVASLLLCAAILRAEMPTGGMGGMGGGGHGGHGGRGRSTDGQATQAHSTAPDTNNLRELLTFDKELGLTDTQEETIMALRSESMKEAAKRYAAAEKPQNELDVYLSQSKPDFVAARATVKEITEILVSARTVSIDAYEKAYSLLTDEQKEKLAAIRKKLKENNESAEGQGRGQMPPMSGNGTEESMMGHR
jgi:Spy/CpxP family protein refolding chaperone